MGATSYLDVLAANIKRIREERGMSQQDLSAFMKALGITWTRVTVARIEASKRQVTAGEAMALQAALRVERSALYETEAAMINVEGATVPEHIFRNWVGGGHQQPLQALPAILQISSKFEGRAADARLALAERYGLSEDSIRRALVDSHEQASRRAAARLEVEAYELALAAISAWGCGFTAERDRRLGRDGARGKAGWITRQMTDEIGERINTINRRHAARRKPS